MSKPISPRPTMEGWIGSLNASGKSKSALVDLIAGVRNRNIDRATSAEVRLERVTNGWADYPSVAPNMSIIAICIREAIRDLDSILSAYDGDDMCDVTTVAQYRIVALKVLLENLEK